MGGTSYLVPVRSRIGGICLAVYRGRGVRVAGVLNAHFISPNIYLRISILTDPLGGKPVSFGGLHTVLHDRVRTVTVTTGLVGNGESDGLSTAVSGRGGGSEGDHLHVSGEILLMSTVDRTILPALFSIGGHRSSHSKLSGVSQLMDRYLVAFLPSVTEALMSF